MQMSDRPATVKEKTLSSQCAQHRTSPDRSSYEACIGASELTGIGWKARVSTNGRCALSRAYFATFPKAPSSALTCTTESSVYSAASYGTTKFAPRPICGTLHRHQHDALVSVMTQPENPQSSSKRRKSHAWKKVWYAFILFTSQGCMLLVTASSNHRLTVLVGCCNFAPIYATVMRLG